MSRFTHATGFGPARRSWRRLTGQVVTALSLLAIAALTLLPQSAPHTPWPGFWCLGCGEFGSVDLFLNVLLFMPLGAGLRMLQTPIRLALILILSTTTAIECLQWLVVPGRDASFADILANTTGGLLGFWLAVVWHNLTDPTPALARRLAVLGLAGWWVLRVVTGLLLSPSFPATDWYGQLAPVGVYPADFPGRIESASVGGQTLLEGLLPGGGAWLAGKPVTVAAQVVTAGPTPALASAASILDSGRNEILVVGQEGNDARFRVRLRAADARLRVPSLRLPDAFRLPAGTPLQLTGMLSDRALVLRAESASTAAACRLALGAGLTWALFLPSDQGLGPWAVWITAAFAAAMWTVVGFWCGRSVVRSGRFPLPAVIGGGLVLVAGFLTPPLVTAAAPADLAEWLFAFSGFVAGVWCGTAGRNPV